jgi:hypothetical protein
MQTFRDILNDAVSPRKRPWILVAIGFVIVIAAWKNKLGSPRQPKAPPDTVEYHYDQWRHHKANLIWGIETNALNLKKAVWHMDGKPTFTARREKMEEHEIALIRHGYFEERSFFGLSVSNLSTFETEFQQQAEASGLDERYSMRLQSFPATNVLFTARPEDLEKIELIMKQVFRASTNAP